MNREACPGIRRGPIRLLAWFGVIALSILSPVHAQSISGIVEHAEIYHLDVGVDGEVASVGVIPGDRVMAGTLLLALDDTVLQAAVVAAEAELAWRTARLDEAERAWERDNELYAEGSMSTVELELRRIARLQAESEARQAEATLAASRSRLNRSRITAPVAGIVLARHVHPGDRINLVSRSRPAIEFATAALVVRGQSAAEAAPAPGQAVELVIGERVLPGVVQSILPAPDGAGSVVTATSTEPLPGPGSAATIRF